MTKEECKRILTEVQKQSYAVFPFPLPWEELKQAADAFLDFLEVPGKEKMTMILLENDPASHLGYAHRNKSKGNFENKEFFVYHPKLEKHFDLEDPKVRNFITQARKVYDAAKSTLKQMFTILSHEEPNFVNHFFQEGKTHRLYLRFNKYDEEKIGERIAKGHYDRGGAALALAESAPGLRIGSLNAPVEIQHHEGHCLFMPGLTLNEFTTKIKFPKAWHDVIQKEDKPYRPGVGRWSIVFFVDPIQQRNISIKEARTYKD